MKIAVIFGGKSTEHQVSVVSGTSVIANLNKEKYDIYPIYIDRNGLFYKYLVPVSQIKVLNIDDKITEIELIPNIVSYLKDIDVVFPVLHGQYGEDGTIQGMLKMLNKKYVGCHELSSSICMDKIYTKMLLRGNGFNLAKDIYLKKTSQGYSLIKDNWDMKLVTIEEIDKEIQTKLNYPVFIKPSKSGSSVGVTKVNDFNTLEYALETAFKYDEKVLIEEEIIGREVEVGIIGNEVLEVSRVGEVLAADDFYSYSSKYKNTYSKTVIPADIADNIAKEIQQLAKRAFRICDCTGLSRIDFFVNEDTHKIILNEINTLPGFTEISMYPQLIQDLGYSYSELLDKLIELA